MCFDDDHSLESEPAELSALTLPEHIENVICVAVAVFEGARDLLDYLESGPLPELPVN